MQFLRNVQNCSLENCLALKMLIFLKYSTLFFSHFKNIYMSKLFQFEKKSDFNKERKSKTKIEKEKKKENENGNGKNDAVGLPMND